MVTSWGLLDIWNSYDYKFCIRDLMRYLHVICYSKWVVMRFALHLRVPFTTLLISLSFRCYLLAFSLQSSTTCLSVSHFLFTFSCDQSTFHFRGQNKWVVIDSRDISAQIGRYCISLNLKFSSYPNFPVGNYSYKNCNIFRINIKSSELARKCL